MSDDRISGTLLKGGAEKARLKRAALLSQVENDPKQLKLFNFSSSSLVNRTETVVSDSEKTAEIKSKEKDLYNFFSVAKKSEVHRKKVVVERINETIKVIGKRELSFRGAKDAEAAYTPNDDSLDHGNFLEMLILISKFDTLLKEHIDEAVIKSKKNREKRELKGIMGPGRQGSFITLLSKTTANYIIDAIGKLMRNSVSEDIKRAQLFSIQINSTQDINVHDQLCVIIHYVSNEVNERLLAVIKSTSGTGESLYNTVYKLLEVSGLDINDCIGSSTDGASNMRGEYNGFSAWLKKKVPEHIHLYGPVKLLCSVSFWVSIRPWNSVWAIQKYLNSTGDSWIINNPGKTMTIYDIPTTVSQAYPFSMTPTNIQSGFRCTDRADPITQNTTNIESNRSLNGNVESEIDIDNTNSSNIPVVELIYTEELIADQSQSKQLSTNTPNYEKSQTIVSPIDIRPFPKAPARKTTKNRRKKIGGQMVVALLLQVVTSSHIDFAEVQLWIIEDAAENGHVQIMMIVASYGQIQWTHVHTFWQPQTDISNASKCSRYAKEQECPWDEQVCDKAASRNNLECLIYAHGNGCPWSEITCVIAARKGHRRILENLLNNGCPIDSHACATVAKYGNLECFMFLHENGCDWNDSTCQKAAKNGHLECLKYATEQGCPWSREVCEEAAARDHLECLIFAHENGCDWTIWTSILAARNGHLRILQYLLNNGYPWSSEMCSAAADRGHLDCLMFLHESGCQWDKSTCMLAACNGHLECLMYAHINGCMWDHLTCKAAAQSGKLDCLIYAHEHGCMWNEATGKVAALHNNLDCLIYAHKNGCPLTKVTCELYGPVKLLCSVSFWVSIRPWNSVWAIQKYLNSTGDSWIINNPGKTMTIYDIPTTVSQAYPFSMTPTNIQSGFRCTDRADPITQNTTNIESNRSLNGNVESEIDIDNTNSSNIPVVELIYTEELIADQSQSKQLSTNTPNYEKSQTIVSPIDIRPFPKAPARKTTKNRRKKIGGQMVVALLLQVEQSSKVTSVLLSILTESSSDDKKQRDKLELDSESEDFELLKCILFSSLIGSIITGLSSSRVTSQFVPLNVYKEILSHNLRALQESFGQSIRF
ncbi:hypothetical protein QTP88_018601 [Uroleucon formosanum]